MKNMRAWLRNQTQQLRSESIFISIFLIFFVFGQLGRITPVVGLSFYPHDLFVLIWLVWHARQLVTIVKRTLGWLPQHPLILTTLIWVLAGLLWGNWQQFEVRPLLILTRFSCYVLFAGSVSVSFQNNRVLLRSLLVVAGNLMLWLGLLQYLLLPDTRFLSILGWDDHYFRLIGPLFDPNFMGMIIVLLMIFTASIHWLLPKKAQYVLQSYYAALLALTYSRASYATAAMAGFLLLLTPYPLKKWRMRERLALGAITIMVFALVLYLAPKPGGEGVKLLRTSSIVARQNSAAQTVNSLTTVDLVIGQGIFSNPTSSNQAMTTTIPQHAQVPDNLLLLLLAGTGIVGTILVISSLVYWIGWLAARETALAIALGVTILHAQFNNTLFEPFISLYLLLAVLTPLDQIQMMRPNTKHFRGKKGQNYVSK